MVVYLGGGDSEPHQVRNVIRCLQEIPTNHMMDFMPQRTPALEVGKMNAKPT